MTRVNGTSLMGRLREAERVSTQLERASDAFSGSPGLDIQNTPDGHRVRVFEPEASIVWCFVLSVNEATNEIIAQEAYEVDGAWGIRTENELLLRGFAAPNWTSEHFEKFIIGLDEDGEPDPDWDGQPTDADMAVLRLGGYFVPMPRFLLADPVAVEDLCVPCEPDPSPPPVAPESPPGGN